MELSFTEIGIKVIIGFFLLFFIAKLLGKTTINQLTPFDFISAIVLSELLGNGIYEENVHLIYIFFTVFLWGSLMILMEKLLLKYRRLRGAFEGDPSIVIQNGKINRSQLKKNRMNINQLLSLLRQSETFSIREVSYAILETNGAISIMKKKKYQKVTAEDMKLPLKPAYISISLIIDGEIIEENLREIGQNISWLTNQLKENGYQRSKEVLYADWIKDDGIYIIPYESKQVVTKQV